MPLELSEGPLRARDVSLGGGAAIKIRPATDFEIRRARAAVMHQLAGLMASQDAAAIAVKALGEAYTDADFSKPEWQTSAMEALALGELVFLCQSGWSGIKFKGEIVERPTRELIGLLLRDHNIARAAEAAVNAAVHAEQAEGNGLPPSPDGTARAAETSAAPAAT